MKNKHSNSKGSLGGFRRWWRQRGSRIAAGTGIEIAATMTLRSHVGTDFVEAITADSPTAVDLDLGDIALPMCRRGTKKKNTTTGSSLLNYTMASSPITGVQSQSSVTESPSSADVGFASTPTYPKSKVGMNSNCMKAPPESQLLNVMLKDIISSKSSVDKWLCSKLYLGSKLEGEVYKGRFCDEDFVVKFVAQSHLVDRAAAMMNCTHPNLATPIARFSSENKNIFLFEVFDQGDLRSFLTKYPGLSIEEKLDILCDVAQGLEYMHQSGLMHLDVKPSNVLVRKADTKTVHSCGNCRFEASVSDWDLTRPIKEGLRNYSGTAGFMAPEIWLKEEVTEKADVFAFGMVICAVLNGHQWTDEYCSEVRALSLQLYDNVAKPMTTTWNEKLWREQCSREVWRSLCRHVILKNEMPKLFAGRGVPHVHLQELKELAQSCLSYEPADRPTMTEVLSKLRETRQFVVTGGPP